jgi:hypothetical protein
MMLPSLVPMLWRLRRIGWLTAIVSAGSEAGFTD